MTLLATLGARTLEIFRSFGHAAFFFFDLLRAIPASLRRFGLVVVQIHAIGNLSLVIILASGLAVGFVLALFIPSATARVGAEVFVTGHGGSRRYQRNLARGTFRAGRQPPRAPRRAGRRSAGCRSAGWRRRNRSDHSAPTSHRSAPRRCAARSCSPGDPRSRSCARPG